MRAEMAANEACQPQIRAGILLNSFRPMEIHRAKPEDAVALTEIAFAAKRHWGYPEQWIQRWKDVLTIQPEFIARNETYVAFLDGQPVGFYALVHGKLRSASRMHCDHEPVVSENPKVIPQQRSGLRESPVRLGPSYPGSEASNVHNPERVAPGPRGPTVDGKRRASLEHLWVLPGAMGQGIGRALFTHAVQRAKALGLEAIEIESDPNAEKFYEQMGARRFSVNITELDGQSRALPLLIYDCT
jgi:ribosomal protein S18 acetylase RimI-like enzyme